MASAAHLRRGAVNRMRNSYETPGYATARDRYTISVTGGVSSVSVR